MSLVEEPKPKPSCMERPVRQISRTKQEIGWQVSRLSKAAVDFREKVKLLVLTQLFCKSCYHVASYFPSYEDPCRS